MEYHWSNTKINIFWGVWWDTSGCSWQNKLQYGLISSIKYVCFHSHRLHHNKWILCYSIISEAYTLQNNTTVDGRVIYAGGLVSKAQYLCSMQENTNWYCKQQPLKHNIIVPTRTILHPRLNVIIIRYSQDIPKNVCSGIQ